jgi:hypothetical protein
MPADRRRRILLTALIAAGVLVVAGVVALVLLLAQANRPGPAKPTGTTEAPSSSTTPAPSPSPSSSPTPTVTAAAGGELVLGAEGFDLRSADGEEFTFRWNDDPRETVMALTAAFGSEPVVGMQEGDSHFPDYTVWSWPGLDFASMVESPGGKTRDEYAGPAWVQITANTVGEVDVSGEFGLAIGISVDEARAAGPDEEFPSRFEDGPRFIFAGDRSMMPPDDDPRPHQVSVIVDADEDDGVTRIRYGYVSSL